LVLLKILQKEKAATKTKFRYSPLGRIFILPMVPQSACLSTRKMADNRYISNIKAGKLQRAKNCNK